MDKTIQERRKRTDRLAAVLVKFGGIGVVGVVLFMATFLVVQSAPLVGGPELGVSEENFVIELTNDAPVMVQGVEPFLEASYSLSADGRLSLHVLADGKLSEQRKISLLAGEVITLAKLSVAQDRIAFATNRGRVGQIELAFSVGYDENMTRSHDFTGDALAIKWLIDDVQSKTIIDISLRDEESRIWGGVVYADGSASLLRGTVKTNRLTGKQQLKIKALNCAQTDYKLVSLLDGGILVLANKKDLLSAWRPDRRFKGLVAAGEWQSDVELTRLFSLIGGGSLIALSNEAQIKRVLMQGQEVGGSQLALANEYDDYAVEGARLFSTSPRQRAFFVSGATSMQLLHGTLGSSLAELDAVGAARQLVMAPRENAMVEFYEDGKVVVKRCELDFLDVTGTALFSKVQYEGLREESFTWQSTGGADSYESKISFIPLIIGTLKGTLWALLPSIPLALLSALYCARFLRGRLRDIIKPAIELLAGIPSVILGFIAALYVAPAIEDKFLAVFILPVVLATLLAVGGLCWSRLSLAKRKRMHEGTVALVMLPVMFVACWAVFHYAPQLEQLLLGMPFREWAPDVLGLPFEQRNSVVVGLAMGFAVTPLIFTLAEDAFRNIPKDLADASLALGATAWQTAVRVILPPAIPGVVSAILLGLGRAVGETMVVLMATGNTPITDWNPLQGFRALSANLAVELPEAEHGGSLYHVLFLSALMLFAITFVVNTFAEIIRVRGRKDL